MYGEDKGRIKRYRVMLMAIAAICFILVFVLDRAQHTQIGQAGAVLTYRSGDVNIVAETTQEQSAQLKKALNRKRLTGGKPQGTFSHDVSVAFGQMTFCPDTGGGPFLRLEEADGYLELSEEELKVIHQVFEAYGGRFPVQ
ncbi:MAG: hypothetical protein ACOX88_00710 [Christensenellales bacterium]|jgi:acylphosphatase